ncbi:unnamed protein product [Dibothriocephalus latus]|uniref:Uncharacterized protein n=1 Tax=Dibothriocephalus latus TaxID=60516 RepID=A0A3P6PZF1_DIBLA|nr:unnamed protein product [Dibothriocephalus latus]
MQTEVSLAQRRLTESEEKLRSRERTMNQALEDCKRDTKRMEESKQLLQSRVRCKSGTPKFISASGSPTYWIEYEVKSAELES